MTALPPLTDVPFSLESDPRVAKAYELCLRTEQNSTQHHLVFARMLGYLILHSPSTTSQECVVADILSCTSQSERLRLGENYMNQFIRPFMKLQSSTPVSSGEDSRQSFLALKKTTRVVEHPQNHKQAKETALIRDGFRCMVTGHYDKDSLGKDSTLLQEVIDNPDSKSHITYCCHIFPEPTNTDISPSSAKLEYAASSWILLQRLGYSNLLEELNGKNIHRLENILTMSADLHNAFDRLELWFEATDELNCYAVKLREDVHPCRLNYPPTTVTFTSTNTNLPSPSPLYLSIHAACAKIAYYSGAAEYIQAIFRDMPDLHVLSDDGSSADLLTFALASCV